MLHRSADRYHLPVMRRLCESMLVPDAENYLDLLSAADRLHLPCLMVSSVNYLLEHPYIWLEKGDAEGLSPYTLAQLKHQQPQLSDDQKSSSMKANGKLKVLKKPPSSSTASVPTHESDADSDNNDDDDNDDITDTGTTQPIPAPTQPTDFILTSPLKLEYPDIYTSLLKSLPKHILLEPSRSLTDRQKAKITDLNTTKPVKPFPLHIIIMSILLVCVYQLLLSGSLVTYAMIPAVNVICFIVFIYFMFIHVTT